MSVDFQQLRELLLAIAETDINELTLKSDDFELTVKKGSVISSSELASLVPNNQIIQPTNIASVPSTQIAIPTSVPETTPPPNPEQKNWVEITSPMVGTFYRAPAPEEPPFAEVGDRIGKGDTVCIIEAMKLMNDIDTEVAGEIMEILVENGEPVEFGQVLMRVKSN